MDQYHNVYWFDPTDMTPLINSPGHVKALEFLQELHQTGPSAQVSWSLGEAWDYFLRGKAVFVFSWGDVGALCQDPARSNIQGVCAASILPASEEYYDHETKEFVQASDAKPVGNTTGGSWHGVISNFSANPEATYSLLALMAIKEVSMWNAQHGWTGVDPGYSYQFLEPNGEATVDDYVKAGWDAEDVKTYTQAYYDNFYADTMLTYLRIPGTFEYWDILDKNLSAAMAGGISAQRRSTTPPRAGSRSPTASAGTASSRTIRPPSATRARSSRPGRTGSRRRARAGPAAGRRSLTSDALDQPRPPRLPAAGGGLGAGVHRVSARLLALPRVLQDREQGRGHPREGAGAGRAGRAGALELRPAEDPQHRPQEPGDHLGFVGSFNFERLFHDPQVATAIWVTAVFVLIAVPAELALGFLLALLFNQRLLARPALRTVMILPIFATPLAVGYLFFTIFYEEGGPLGFLGIPFLSDPGWAMFSIILVDVWQWTPFCFLVFLAALQGVPDELYEAARIDGASNLDMLTGCSCRCSSRRS